MFKMLLIALSLASLPTIANADIGFSFEIGPRYHRGPGIYIGPRPYYPTPRYYPAPRWQETCEAHNGRGFEFHATEYNRGRAADAALWECRNSRTTYNPNSCHIVWCR